METIPAGEASGAPRSGLRRLTSLAVDVRPLRESREFRLLFIGQGVSFAGSMITYVAIPFQVYEITRSSLVVGLVSLAELFPILLMSFVGGALADAVDRRRMVRITQISACARGCGPCYQCRTAASAALGSLRACDPCGRRRRPGAPVA